MPTPDEPPDERTPADDAIDVALAIDHHLKGPAGGDPPDPWTLVSTVQAAGCEDLLPSVEELAGIIDYLQRVSMAIEAPDRETWVRWAGEQTYRERRFFEALSIAEGRPTLMVVWRRREDDTPS